MKNGEQPAFPDTMRGAEQSMLNQAPHQLPTGLAKRELIAAMAMQGILANGNEMIPKSGSFDTWNYWEIAQTSVKAADELLKALES